MVKAKKKKIPRNTAKSLTKAELKLIAELLELASSEFSNHGCADYKIPATEENKNIMLEMFEANGDVDDRQDDVQEVLNAKDELDTYDWLLMSYLAGRCQQLSEKK